MSKEKIIQVVTVNETFWGSFRSNIMLLTDRGNMWYLKEGKWKKTLDLPEELQP